MTGIFSEFGLYWRTLRRLKRRQIVGRFVFRFKNVRADLSSPPALRTMVTSFIPVARRAPSMSGKETFAFLNEGGDLANDGWNNPQREKLWRYNQHYFDDLNARSAEERLEWHRALVKRWIYENSPGQEDGWEPYPTSLRIVNWVKWALLGEPLSEQVRHSLSVQARWLKNKIEWHLLGNHLFANAKGLIFVGCFFEGEEANGWLSTGAQILLEQLGEQILTDGGQFELSPMYHALAVEDVLDLLNILRASGASGESTLIEALEEKVEPMLEWLLAMSHPDGGIAFFNDAANGIAPENIELVRYARSLGFTVAPPVDGITHHVESGYVRMARGPALLIADLASIGPDYLPGHAHADTLSFEFTLYGKRIFVNSGTSVYGTGPERLRQRGTAAHSTLVVDGENSSEVWSGFRVGRRAKPFDVAAYEDGTNLIAHGAHDGYTHLPGSPVHRRRWRLSEDRLFVEDTVEGFGAHQLEAYFHLGPGISAVAETANGVVELRDADSGRQAKFSAEGGVVEVMPSSWHPEFGLSVATKVIRVSAEGSLPHTLRCELAWNTQ